MKIAIVDDEQEQRDTLMSYLSRFSAENNVDISGDVFTDPNVFLSSFKDDYSLLLLDIEMPGMTGLDLAKKIRERGSNVGIIFVTVMAQYAINGYEVNALDFMVKPVNYFPFSMKMLKAYKNLNIGNRIILKSEGEKILIDEKDILYIEGSNQYVVFHISRQKPIRAKMSLKDAEEKLSKNLFERCSNSFIVNLDKITKVSGNDLYINDDIIPISRSKKKTFIEKLNRHFGGI